MSSKNILFTAIFYIIVCGTIYFIAVKCTPQPMNNENIEKKLEILERKIDSLSFARDSIRAVIDTAKVKIIEIHEEYNKIHTNIIHQPVDSDYVQFSKYCSDNKGLLNINNP